MMFTGIAVVTLNRPEARNAIGVEMLKKLRAVLEALHFHSSARALLLCSTVPGVFCAGADLKVTASLYPSAPHFMFEAVMLAEMQVDADQLQDSECRCVFVLPMSRS